MANTHSSTRSLVNEATDEELEHEYRPLPNTESVRVLTLEPGEKGEPLRGILATGRPQFDREIFITTWNVERPIKMTVSLYEGLQRLRHPRLERRIWADQICVNQNDLQERSQQMQFMNIIFHGASKVLVWLGLDEKLVARLAFEFVHELDQLLEGSEDDVSHAEALWNKSEGSLTLFHDLTQLEWFKRGWVVQEIGTEAQASLFWGDMEIDWNVLSKVCRKLSAYHHLRSTYSIRSSDIKYFHQRFVKPDMASHHANRVNFVYELHRARCLRFTDDRDRVFAWLGHFSLQFSNRQLTTLRADYHNSVAKVFVNTAKRAIEGDTHKTDGNALMTLAAVQHVSIQQYEEGRTGVAADYLPSWVPDWRAYQSFILSEPISPHRAHGTSSAKLEFIGAGQTLRIHGVEIDTIKVHSRPLRAKTFHGKEHTEVAPSPICYIWQQICGKDQFSLCDKDMDTQGSLFTCMQTLSNGCVQIALREKTSYHDIPRLRWLQQQAVYLVNMFGESDIVADDVRQLAAEADQDAPEQWSRSASAASKNRSFAITSRGYYVLGPKSMRRGDVICVLFGGKVPFCLRPIGTRYLLVGECYVHGLMDGEAMTMMDRGELVGRYFDIV
ncbi:hypothetical protein PRZ48_002256 [Zasmidium cellare]|uniref:Heterokaryon incompatibility domain-containing protein n=1 Tax=Zasmidium cellare TaxID=395010 RepID=A0ABR0F3Q7_ZASCE|nr:hypothetical protein PRZ48_002256 [Zasmidium cellare]